MMRKIFGAAMVFVMLLSCKQKSLMVNLKLPANLPMPVAKRFI
jgi:hypothetical protein